MITTEKTRYSEAELEEFKALINQKLTKAREELDLYLSQLNDRAEDESAKVKGMDGVGTVEVERLQTLAARQKKYIQHLENALIRIDNNVYGVCRETGKLIRKERLMAVPHATLSIAAKQARKPVRRRRR
ncbi:MAG: TraR/DksA family transcriptional regulator [Saprospiraceae bacterium]